MLPAYAALAWSGIARAEQGHQRIIPFLIDLPGWTAAPPAGSEVKAKGGRVVTASRSYTRGEAVLAASVISGTAALARGNGNVSIKLKPVHENTSVIDGFQVKLVSTPILVIVAITLSADATFSLLFNNVSEDEAMTIARTFDWARIQAALDER